MSGRAAQAAWGCAELLPESAGQGGGGGKTGAECDFGEWMPGVRDHPAGGGEAEGQGISARCQGDVFAEQGFETAGRQADGGGGGGDGFRGIETRLHPGDGGCHTRVKAGVGFGRADLRFRPIAGGGQERRRDLKGKRGPMACADQVQHQVGGRGGTACGKAGAVDNETVGDDIGIGVAGGKILQVFPVDGGAVAAQKARAGEDPAARINAADGAEARGSAGKVADQRGGGDL